MDEHNYRHFHIRIRLPIQLLTCKFSERSTLLPEYAESARVTDPRSSLQLCRCSSGSKKSLRIDEQEEPAYEHGEQPARTSAVSEPPAYSHDSGVE
jgi:hypothetical protein